MLFICCFIIFTSCQDNFQSHQEDNTTSQDNFQPHLEDDTTKDGIGDQMTGVTSRARTTPRSTSQDKSQQILNPGHTDTMPCEYTSIETLEKRTVIGFRLCHTFRSHEAAREPGNPARNSSGTTVLYRDKATHSYVQTNFESIKGYGKKMTEVKEGHAVALAQRIQTTTVTKEDNGTRQMRIETTSPRGTRVRTAPRTGDQMTTAAARGLAPDDRRPNDAEFIVTELNCS